MIDFSTLFLGASICLAGVMSPGPNFLAVSHRSATAERQEALALVVGIAVVNMGWSFLALFGVGFVTSALPWALGMLKYVGAAYLAWLGARLLQQAGRRLSGQTGDAGRPGVRQALMDGMATNLANPKAMVFYASVFVSAIPAQASTGTLLALVLIVGVVAVAWYGGLAFAFSATQVAGWFQRRQASIERGCGLLLLILSVRQVLVS